MYRHHFQECCDHVQFDGVCFFVDSGEILALRSPDFHGNEKKAILSLSLKDFPLENSKVFYGITITIDNRALIASGSVNVIEVGGRSIALAFFTTDVHGFRPNQLPRILWKTKEGVYLGHSEYVPYENNLKHSMVGYSDQQLYLENGKDTFKNTDEAIFQKGVCFWDTFGTIRVNAFTSLIKYQKFPYYSLSGDMLGAILVYQPINETASLVKDTEDLDDANLLMLIKRMFSQSNMFVGIQNHKNKRVVFLSENFQRLGYPIEDFMSSKMQLRDLVHPDDLYAYRKALEEEVYIQKRRFQTTVRLLNSNKEAVRARLNFVPMLSKYREIEHVMLVIEFLDISDHSDQQNKIILSLADKGQTVYALRHTSNPMQFDFITKNIRQYGHQAKDLLSDVTPFASIVFHDDLELVKNALEQLQIDGLRQIRFEYRIVTNRKSLEWVEEKCYLVQIDGVFYLESMISNITLSKRASMEFGRSEYSLSKKKTVDQSDNIRLDHVFASIHLTEEMKKFQLLWPVELALFDVNHDVLWKFTTSETTLRDRFGSRDREGLMKLHEICDHSEKSQVCLTTSILIDDTCIGHILFFAEDHQAIDLDKFQIDAKHFTDTISKLAKVARIALYQSESSFHVRGDLSRVRNKHAMLLEVLRVASESTSLEACFDQVYPRIGEVFQLSRGSLFLYDQEHQFFDCVREWSSPNDRLHQKEYQRVKKELTFFRDWNLEEQGSFAIDFDDEVEESLAFRSNASAIVGVRVMEGNQVRGILNFVDNHSQRIWSDDDIMLLEDIGFIFSYLMEKTSSIETIRQNQSQLFDTLDAMPLAIGIFEKNDEHLVHANPKFLEIFPMKTSDDELRMEAMKELMRDHQNEPATDELYLPDLDRWYMIEKNPAEKSFGQDACMMTLTDITENKKNADILARMAFYDVLSKLPNRSRFELDVKHMYELSPATFGNAFVGILNIDNFKMLNNTFSYSYGDAVIREIAKKLTGIPELKGRVYRFGGDEFSFIVENSFGEHVYELCSKVMQIFEKPFYVEGYESYVTVSLGIGFLSDTDRDTDDLIRKTNLSLSEAKASGKNKFVLYDVSLRKYEEDNVYLERSLKIAVEHDCAEFEVYFQPIVDAKSNRVVAAEALVRWFSADLGFVPPVKFIPIAESTGLIIPLGKHILKQACKEARKWIDNGFDIQVSVNFSVIQTLQSDLVSTIMSALHTYRVPPKNLMVEITESLAIKDMKKVIDILSSIRQIGVKIAMDDFGTGYSSLSHLRKLPLDYVKIDRSFAFNLEYDPYYFSFIETITQFCHLNNTLVCVEGVENDNQRRLLQTSSVDNLQGYLFGHPASAGDFFRILVHTNN